MSNDTDLAGLTADDCCSGCGPGFCCITGEDVCGHPHKGGLQALHMMNPAILGRYRSAKRLLVRLEAERKEMQI